MKAISIRNPFAHFILCGEKTIECRSWQTNYRGDLLICSSANPKIKDTICGHAICVANLESIEAFEAKRLEDACMSEMPEGKHFAWHLTNIRMIHPFPVKGKLNLYEVDDSLINILVDGDEELSEEDAQDFYDRHIEPFLYKGKEK